MKSLATLGIASDLGGNQTGSRHGPATLRNSLLFKHQLAKEHLALDWLEILEPEPKQNVLESLRCLTSRIAARTQQLVHQRQPFLAVGGDHSQAMGIWRGVLTAVPDPRSFGLIWIDAHMDAHDFSTTPSGNVHGMPLAALLGTQDVRLQRIMGQSPTLNPALVTLVGIRSYQPEEIVRLGKYGVNVVYMAQLDTAKDQAAMIRNLIREVANQTAYYGISIDIDGLDPGDAPATGTPEPAGIHTNTLCQALAAANSDPGFIGLEIAEFLPEFDKNQLTEQAIGQLILSAFRPHGRTV